MEISGTKAFLLATYHFHSRSSVAKQAEFNSAELVKKKEGTFTVPAVITDYLKKDEMVLHKRQARSSN